MTEVPPSLLRADGRSVYRRHGGTRYATSAQLSVEDRMAAQASAPGAPRLTREAAARALGADPARLEQVLVGCADGAAVEQRTSFGPREDQAAAGRRTTILAEYD